MGSDHRVSRPSALVAALAVAVSGGSVVGCRKPLGADRGAPSVHPSSEPPPVDRLAPGELPAGSETVFGLVLPRGLTLIGVFPGVAHAAGPLTIEDVSNYVRARVDLRRVELGAVGTVFPQVHIAGGDPGKVFRIEVSAAGTETHLTIRDVTKKAATPVEHISNEEAWRRAGFKPDGTPLDPVKLQ
jgi:hypothetical protein